MDIEEIKNKVTVCTSCQLCQTRTNSVPGRGNKNADIIFVGEAPGRHEDVHGEPFVGAAGKKLSQALKGAGVLRDEVYITNVVKCRPPNNRVPTVQERQQCSVYLKGEIESIKPQLVCIMGNTAFGSLLNGSDIMKNRGKLFSKDGILYFISIHPAATIYRQELTDILKEDMKKLVKIAGQIKRGESVKIDGRT